MNEPNGVTENDVGTAEAKPGSLHPVVRRADEIPQPFSERILDYISANRDESKRCMSGLVAKFGNELTPQQIRSILDELVHCRQVIRYGNGKRHCWKMCEHV